MLYNRDREVPFQQTLDTIYAILKENNIPIKIDWHSDRAPFSCTISSNGIYANGKGVSTQAALCSGLAEFLEYLQGGLLINPTIDIQSAKYICQFNDDTLLPVNEALKEMPKDLLSFITTTYRKTHPLYGSNSTNFSFEEFFGGNIIPCRKYTGFSAEVKGTAVQLPISLLYGPLGNSTGFASGNTYEEALAHALFEVLERAIIFSIVINNKGSVTRLSKESVFEYDILKEMTLNIEEASGTNIEFFAFEMESQVPIAAILVVKPDNSYCLRFGTGVSYQIAVERALTEFAQGNDFNNRFTNTIYLPSDIPFRNYINYCNILMHFNDTASPIVFMDSPVIPIPAYTLSYSEVCDKVPELVKYLGLGDLYARDYSILGFPTVHVFATRNPFYTITDETYNAVTMWAKLTTATEECLNEDLYFRIADALYVLSAQNNNMYHNFDLALLEYCCLVQSGNMDIRLSDCFRKLEIAAKGDTSDEGIYEQRQELIRYLRSITDMLITTPDIYLADMISARSSNLLFGKRFMEVLNDVLSEESIHNLLVGFFDRINLGENEKIYNLLRTKSLDFSPHYFK